MKKIIKFKKIILCILSCFALHTPSYGTDIQSEDASEDEEILNIYNYFTCCKPSNFLQFFAFFLAFTHKYTQKQNKEE